jgi:hypothetical protein
MCGIRSFEALLRGSRLEETEDCVDVGAKTRMLPCRIRDMLRGIQLPGVSACRKCLEQEIKDEMIRNIAVSITELWY